MNLLAHEGKEIGNRGEGLLEVVCAVKLLADLDGTALEGDRKNTARWVRHGEGLRPE